MLLRWFKNFFAVAQAWIWPYVSSIDLLFFYTLFLCRAWYGDTVILYFGRSVAIKEKTAIGSVQ